MMTSVPHHGSTPALPTLVRRLFAYGGMAATAGVNYASTGSPIATDAAGSVNWSSWRQAVTTGFAVVALPYLVMGFRSAYREVGQGHWPRATHVASFVAGFGAFALSYFFVDRNVSFAIPAGFVMSQALSMAQFRGVTVMDYLRSRRPEAKARGGELHSSRP